MRGLGKIEGNTASPKRHQEALCVHVRHEMVNGRCALRWGLHNKSQSLKSSTRCLDVTYHAAVQHNSADSCAAQAPLNELQHRSKLTENDRLVRALVRPQLM